MCDVAPTECCGVQELAYISGHKNAEDVLTNLAPFFHHLKGVVMFSGVTWYPERDKTEDDEQCVRPQYAQNLAKYIIANKLGKVTSTRPTLNLNSGNWIKVYLWSLDMDRLQGYWKDRKIRVGRNDY